MEWVTNGTSLSDPSWEELQIVPIYVREKGDAALREHYGRMRKYFQSMVEGDPRGSSPEDVQRMREEGLVGFYKKDSDEEATS